MNKDKVLIIYAHPNEKSFNHAEFESVKIVLNEKKISYEIIALNKEKFNPVFSKGELALYRKTQFLDLKVGEYQKKIENANFLIFIFPIWWGDMPAILKGFIEKVFLPGWAYNAHHGGLHGKLTNIKKAVIINTMSSPKAFYKFILKNPIKQILIKDTLKICGIRKFKLLQLGRAPYITNKKREKWLKKIDNYIKNKLLK